MVETMFARINLENDLSELVEETEEKRKRQEVNVLNDSMVEVAEPRMFAGINLEKYLKPINKEEIEQIPFLKNAAQKLILPSERFQLKQLIGKINGLKNDRKSLKFPYPALDTSFLSMNNKISFNNEISFLQVPKFSVYSFYKANKFLIKFFEQAMLGRGPYFRDGNKVENIKITNNCLTSFKTNIERKLPSTLLYPLYKSFGCDPNFSEINKRTGYFNYWDEERLNPRKISISGLTSTFNGIIPEETKEKVKQAEQYFNKKDFYIIAETKPEEWNIQVIKADPLVVGVKYDKCFLIDHFNTTSLENYVRSEFLDVRNLR